MIITALISLCAEVLSQTFTPSKPVDLSLQDTTRDKELPVRVTYPEESGKYPLIVFSHGLGGSRDAMQPLVEPWVKSGYVVIQPQHADSGVLNQPGARRKTLQQLSGRAVDRPADITFVFDSLKDLEKQIPDLAGKIDPEKIAMAGHSYGAWTTMAIGGLGFKVGNRRVSLDDARPKCLLMISPQGPGQTIDAESYKSITRPTLMISGSEDTSPFDDKPAESRQALFNNQLNGDKFMLWIEGAHHNFGGISGKIFRGAGPQSPETVNLVVQSSLSFFDTYLKSNADQKVKLNNGDFALKEGPKFKWSVK